ncbi:MAG: hypothetical protein HS104_02425 [Polyangiaceae bacterium]|nr:hypothetical protein [Polyangiaceae bacterium]MCL4751142.1 hypothetical protein [Myxococcales bacterium]
MAANLGARDAQQCWRVTCVVVAFLYACGGGDQGAGPSDGGVDASLGGTSSGGVGGGGGVASGGTSPGGGGTSFGGASGGGTSGSAGSAGGSGSTGGGGGSTGGGGGSTGGSGGSTGGSGGSTGGSGGSTGGTGGVACVPVDGGAGAGGTAGSPDGGGCGPTPLGFTGACKPGAPTACCAATLPVMTRQGSLPPNWSCIGVGDGGTGGAGGTGGGGGQNTFRVEDWSSSTPVGDMAVDLFAGDSILGATPFHSGYSKGPNHPGPAALGVGELYFPHPASATLSYLVHEVPGVTKPFYGFGLPVPAAPGLVTGSAVSATLYQQLANFCVPLVGWTPPPDLALIMGPIRDCDGNDVGGARVKFFDAHLNQEVVPGTCPRDVRYVYFDGALPNPKCEYTSSTGSAFIIANALQNAACATQGKKLRLEFWGRLQASNAGAVKFAERMVEVFPDTINLHVIQPNVQQ